MNELAGSRYMFLTLTHDASEPCEFEVGSTLCEVANKDVCTLSLKLSVYSMQTECPSM